MVAAWARVGYGLGVARKLRVQFEGAIYHVTLRGVEQRVIFTEDRECERFLERVGDGVETHDVRVYLYCLMRNHYILFWRLHGVISINSCMG